MAAVLQKKITSYFSPVSRESVSVSPLNCFETCLHERADEEKGQMISCDGCASWFHVECVEGRKQERPRPDVDGAAWFCSSCFSVFTEVKKIKQEVLHLKTLLNDVLNATVKPARKVNKHEIILTDDEVEEDEHGQAVGLVLHNDGPKSKHTTTKPCSNSTAKVTSDDELETLRKENYELRIRVETMKEVIDSLMLEDINCKNASAPKKNNWQTVTKKKTQRKQLAKETSSPKTEPQPKKSTATLKEKKDPIPASGESDSSKKNVLVLGDSHVRRLDQNKLQHIKLAGVGGLKSGNIISTHKGIINSSINQVDEVIIHIGSNDIAKGVQVETLINNIDTAAKELQKKNPNVRIACSKIFLQKYNPSLNAKVVEANDALKLHCFSQGWDCIEHGNIAFKHLLNDGMHLNPEGNRLFANNLTKHVKSG